MTREAGFAPPLAQGLMAMALTLALAHGAALAQTADAPAAGAMGEELLAMPIPSDPALRKISVVVDPGLRSSRKLPSALREQRKAMQDGQDIPLESLIRLAELRDGLAAQKYVRHLVATGGSDSDIAFFASIAVSTGRVWTLPEAVAAMRRLDPATEPPERVKTYMAMIYPHAWAGNSLALEAVVTLNGKGRLFGEMSDKTRKQVLEQAQKLGDGRLELLMAMNLMRDPASRALSAEEIRSYLERAATSQVPGIRSAATALLASMAAGARADGAGDAMVIPASAKVETQP